MDISDGKHYHPLFQDGVHPPDGKALTNECAISDAPLLDKYTVIFQQHIGAPPKPVVAKGDSVKKGALLAESGGFVSAPVHSPTSGTVSALTEVMGPMGTNMAAVEIASDGNDELASPFDPIEKWDSTESDVLKKRVGEAGIVGMGGAAFPTTVKLSPPADNKIDTLIINAAECEPFLTADHRTMLERPDAMLEGAAILARILGVDKIVVGVESNKPDAIEILSGRADRYDIKILEMRVRYPQGAEKQLIYAVTGRKVPAGGLPMAVGCVVQNVGTSVAVQEAVVDAKPLFERVTTVTGAPLVSPGNWRFRIGTPLSKVLELAGGVKYQPAKVIFGGPMMGFAQKSLDAPIMKNSSGVLLLSKDEVTQFESDPCIRCGKCVDACPMDLLPGTISAAAENERFDIAEDYRVMDCIECGSCSYVCPAHRPLVQLFKRSKAEITAKGKT